MKQLKLKISLFILIPLFIACPNLEHKSFFRFDNKSMREVYIDLGEADRDMWGGTLYPDTAIAEIRGGTPFKRNESRYYSFHYEGQDTLSLFIFDADTFNIYSWEQIKNGYKILQRYDISMEHLKKLQYIISYPPTEAMKNMKMWPPYENK